MNRCQAELRQEDSTHDLNQCVSAQNWPQKGPANTTPGSLPDYLSQKERTLSRLSKAVSPVIIEGRGFVINRVLGFMMDKKRLVCQD